MKPIEARWRMYASVNWVIIGPDIGLSPMWRQGITWNIVDLLSIASFGTNFGWIWI